MSTHTPDETRRLRRRGFLRTGLGATLLGLSTDPIGRLVRAARPEPLRVRAWCEGTAPKSVYPRDVDGALEEILGGRSDIRVSRSRLEEADAGLSDPALDETDVLVWWGRLRHDELPEERARAVAERVRTGRLGFVALFGSYASGPFRELMGMACEPGAWRDEGRREEVAIAAPKHPIVRGVMPFTVPQSRMFAEPFQVPEPEAVLLLSTWETGETFRSGLTWTVGRGRVAYLRHADDAFPVLFHPSVRTLVGNAALWAAGRE